MDVMTYEDAHTQLNSIMDSAIHDHQEIIVTRGGGESVVIVSLETWNSVNETLHALSSPKNASRLRAAMAQLNAGAGEEHELIE